MSKIVKLSMVEKVLDATFSLALFILINAAGIYLVLADDAFLGIEYPVIQIICYIFLYINLAIAVFGYRVWEINCIVTLAKLWGKKVELNIDEIKSVLSILGYMYLLKTDRGNFMVWRNLRIADKERLVAIAKNNQTGSE